jgi:hypothetical protein
MANKGLVKEVTNTFSFNMDDKDYKNISNQITNRFSGLISLWMIRRQCRNERAEAMSRVIEAESSSENVVTRAIVSNRSPP